MREMSSTTSSTTVDGGGEGVMEDLTDFEVCFLFSFFLPLCVCGL